MPKNKVELSIEIESDHLEFLEIITDEYRLSDESKAIRVLIDYAMEIQENDLIFSKTNTRCMHCD